jgi:hypothetical protein
MVIHKKRDKALRGSSTRTYLAWNVRQQSLKPIGLGSKGQSVTSVW